MTMISEEKIKTTKKILLKEKAFTIDLPVSLLDCSTPGARLKLRQWGAYTSYNQNGRYYALPAVPRFDENGLWRFRQIYFSRQGTLKKTVVYLVRKSSSGLDGNQIGEPLALMHDMGSGILSAVAEVFPNAPDFICHFHFLRDVGKDLMLQDYQTINDRLRVSGVRSELRKKGAYLEKKFGRDSQGVRDFSASLASGSLTSDHLEQIPAVATCALIHWAFEAPRVSKGYGFPFDRPHFEFYLRLKEIHRVLENIMDIRLRKVLKDNRPFANAWRLIGEVLSDKKLKSAVNDLERKSIVFDELRAAMRIAPPDGENGLNDDADEADMKTIEKGVKTFRKKLEKREDRQTCCKKMAEQIDKYWDKLFADPITVDTPDGPLVITPQRTNNILERFFRGRKRSYRKKSGTSSLSKTLKSLLADTPLVSNLYDQGYREIILDGCGSLEERFSGIDAKLVREEMKQAKKNQDKISPEVKKIISRPDLPQEVSTLFSTFSHWWAYRR